MDVLTPLAPLWAFNQAMVEISSGTPSVHNESTELPNVKALERVGKNVVIANVLCYLFTFAYGIILQHHFFLPE